MKITPIEIRQREFERHFRGYDKDEVNAFLQTLSQAWESLLEENKDIKNQLGAAQKELAERREAEGSLFKTLRTAEETGASIVDRANITAEQRLQEVKEEAEKIISQAQAQAQAILSQTDGQAQQVVRRMEEKVAILQQDYRRAQASYTEVLSQLTDVAEQALRAVEYAEKESAEDMTALAAEAQHIKESYQPPVVDVLEDAPAEPAQEEPGSYEEDSNEIEEPSYDEPVTTENEYEEQYAEVASVETSPTGSVSRPTKRGSFFDEID